MINDVKNLKESGGATIEELREFLKTLKARNPQEVIGIVKASLLIQSLVMSCIATAAILVVFTVGPYLIYGPNKPAKSGAKPALAATASDSGKSAPDPAAASTATVTGSTPSGAPDAAKAVKAMGLDETKPADPKKNPLDKPDLDKLLDGL